jgi:hypothetical protein
MNRFFKVVDKSAKDSFPGIFEMKNPSLLYHYTSFESSRKILEGNSIRFTHVKFMNDYEEMRYGLHMFYELVCMMINEENDKAISYFLFVLFCSIVVSFENERERNGVFSMLKDKSFDKDNPEQYAVLNCSKAIDIYVACFSAEEAKDSLPMWYMYAAHGTGVCLGFDAKKLIEAHQRRYEDQGFPEPFDTSCFYGPEGTNKIREFKQGLFNFITNISEFIRQHYSAHGTPEELNKAEFLELTMHYIIVAVLSFKHGAFAHESERRLFVPVPRDNISHVRFDEKKLPYMVPYVLMPYNALAKNLLKEIWLAPAHLNGVDTAKTFFSQETGNPIEVIKSRIPFRKV